EGFREAIRGNDLQPLGDPEVDFDNLALERGKPFEFEVAFDVRPKIALPEWKKTVVERQTSSVSETKMDDALTTLRTGHRRVVTDETVGVPADGLALAKVEFFHEGKSALLRDSVRIAPSTPIPDCDPGAFTAALQGRRKGETFDLEVQFQPGFEQEALVGKKGSVRIEVLEVYRLVDPTDEELAKALDFADFAALREDV